MRFLDTFFNKKNEKKSGGIARDRLQILLAHEKNAGKSGEANLLRTLHCEIIEVLSRHIPVDQDNVKISLDKGKDTSRLEIDIQVPESGLKAQVYATKSD